MRCIELTTINKLIEPSYLQFFFSETLRLVGGSNRYEGRLEILTQRGWGEWGTICDNHLNDKLAVVACRSLGLPS